MVDFIQCELDLRYMGEGVWKFLHDRTWGEGGQKWAKNLLRNLWKLFTYIHRFCLFRSDISNKSHVSTPNSNSQGASTKITPTDEPSSPADALFLLPERLVADIRVYWRQAEHMAADPDATALSSGELGTTACGCGRRSRSSPSSDALNIVTFCEQTGCGADNNTEFYAQVQSMPEN